MALASVAGRWLYRSRQFFTALLGRVRAAEMDEAQSVLGPTLYQVFAAMPGQYRRHALTVYRRVRERGCDDKGVLQAALLHDTGKHDPSSGRHVTLAHRVAIVLLKSVPPGLVLLRKVSYPSSRGLRGYLLYAFYLSRHHAQLGARMAAEHGASRRVVELIARHHEQNVTLDGLGVLQAADEQS